MANKKIIHPDNVGIPSIGDYFKVLSLPVGTKIIIKGTDQKCISDENDGKVGEISRFLNGRYVIVTIGEKSKHLKIPFNNIGLAFDQKINFFRRVLHFMINSLFYNKIGKSNDRDICKSM